MGGSAFGAILTSAAFPRLPPSVYRALKKRLLPKITEFYAWVGVPHEAPDKKDHGDLDLLVAIPKLPHNSFVPHEIIKQAIGATHLVPMDGNRTSNYAVPIRRGEWASLGHAEGEDELRSANEDGEIYYQVRNTLTICEISFNPAFRSRLMSTSVWTKKNGTGSYSSMHMGTWG
jgi:hypothetical protein